MTAGTLGMYVETVEDDMTVVLSNNHVLADTNAGKPGDVVLQPGSIDGGAVPADNFGRLLRFVEIHFEERPDDDCCPFAQTSVRILNWLGRMIGSRYRFHYRMSSFPDDNTVDVAIATIDNPGDIDRRLLDQNDKPTITVKGMRRLQVGDSVRKSGRTTGLTSARVTGVDGQFVIGYGGGRMASFAKLIVIDGQGFSAGGDSGSGVLDEGDFAGGLLFAGNEAEGFTLACHIDDALESVGARL